MDNAPHTVSCPIQAPSPPLVLSPVRLHMYHGVAAATSHHGITIACPLQDSDQEVACKQRSGGSHYRHTRARVYPCIFECVLDSQCRDQDSCFDSG
jgi:hypothetical protein